MLCPPNTLAFRPATTDDLPFIDALQKRNSHAVGYFPRQQLAEYVRAGWGVVAEEVLSAECSVLSEDGAANVSPLGTQDSALGTPRPVGYILYKDRYLKRDELGVVFQLNVVEAARRRLVGAGLVRAALARSAYGCRLFCCWCAQDLAANRFWEGLGFVPLAFRAGSKGKRRVHIFWQRRINDGDDATPYWYPFQTNAGAIRQDRIVFPIPPGVRWEDVNGDTLREMDSRMRTGGTGPARVEGPASTAALALPAPPESSAVRAKRPASRPKSKTLDPKPGQIAVLVGGRLRYVTRPGYVPPAKPKRTPRDAEAGDEGTIDPAYLAAARDLRDRYLETLNRTALPAPVPRHEVARRLISAADPPDAGDRPAQLALPEAA